MKLTLFLNLLLFLPLYQLVAQESNFEECQAFTLNLYVSNLDTATMTFIYRDCYDSEKGAKIFIKHGKVTLTGKINQAEEGILFTNPKDTNFDGPHTIRFILQPAKMTLSFNTSDRGATNIKMEGSPSQAEKEVWELSNQNALMEKQKIRVELSTLISKREKGEYVEEELNLLSKQRDTVWSSVLIAAQKYIEEHPSSYFSAYLLGYFRSSFPLSFLKKSFLAFSPTVRNSQLSRSLLYEVNGLWIKLKDDIEFRRLLLPPDVFQRLENAKSIFDFELVDQSNKKVNLSRFEGKYLFLDFWASWCGSCIAQFPKINTEIENAKGTPVLFISISVDTKFTTWVRTLERNNLKSVNLLDSSGILRSFYGLNIFPTYLIIGPDGSIYQRNPPVPGSAGFKKMLERIQSAPGKTR